MKKTIILLILFAVAKFAVSQQYQYVPLPDSGAIWSEEYNYNEYDWPECHPSVYERFAINGEDTVINNVTYKKIFLFYDTVFDKLNAIYVGGIREKNKRIYFYGDSAVLPFNPALEQSNNNEILLYDFNVNVGDTIKDDNFNGDWVIVSNIDTIQIGNSLRKRIHFQGLSTEWIEGIGSTHGLLFATMGETTKGLPTNYLICFIHNEDTVHFLSGDCFPTNEAVENIKISNLIKVSPNPAIKDVMFNFKDLKIEKLEIRHWTGKVYDSYDISGKHEFLLPVSNYKSGIYFYIATDISGKSYTGKFVVN